MKKRSLILSLLLASLLLGACAGTARPAYEMVEAPMGLVESAPVEMEMAVDSFAAGEPMMEENTVRKISDQAGEVERIVIRNANMVVVVEDPAKSAVQIGRMAEEMGGFIVSSNIYVTTFSDTGVTANQGFITVRVPVDRLDEALETIKASAIEVRSVNVSGEDMTQQYVDLESRLRNLEAAEDQLLEIMDDAVRTEDVLNVFQQLTQVRQEIEIIQGQLQYLSESARFSAIAIELIPDAAAQPFTIGSWRPVGTMKDAVQALVNGLRILGDVLIWGVICVLPFVLLLGIPAYFIIRAVRRRRVEKLKDKPEA